MNTETKTPLEQWTEETKKKNLSLKDLENYIRKAITCPNEIYSKLPGFKASDKAEILFAEWKNEPKPIEKWSVGSYVVFLKNVGNTKAGHIDVITKKIDVMSVYLEKYLTLSTSRESKGEIKWFATEAEAEEFAETLVKPVKQEELIQEIGVWYKWIKHSNSRDGLKYAKAERFSGNILYYSERIDVDGTYKKQNNNCSWDAEMVKINLSEIQEFLPDGHSDKVKTKFTVGTWYKLDNWISKFHHIEEDYRFYGENIDTDSGYLDPLGWLSLSEYTPIALSIEEVQQYLPDGHPDKDFVLPDKWCIKVTSKNRSILSKWRTSKCLPDSNGYCLNKHVLVPGIIGYWIKEKPENYTEITMEQFNKYVLIKEAEPMTTAEELIAEAKRRYPIGTKFIPAHASQNFDYFCIVCTTDFIYENGCLYAVLPDNTVYDSQNNPEYGNCSLNRVIFYSKEWANILPTENKPQFEVGKWYYFESYNSNVPNIARCDKLRSDNFRSDNWVMIHNIVKGPSIGGWKFNNMHNPKELSIEEVQQYLPDNHPDKIKPNQKFKIGDWVINLERSISYKKDEVCRVSKMDKTHLACENKPQIKSSMKPFKYFRHATQEEINNHLASTAEALADEFLTPKYTIYGGVTYVGGTGIVEGPLKMILSIDDEELPMVDIIKTNSTKLLNIE